MNASRSKTVFALGALLLALFAQVASASQEWALVEKARSEALRCNAIASFDGLFALAGSGEYQGAASIEGLAEANEAAFLACPILFLQALAVQSESMRQKVLGTYFGVVHEPCELTSALASLAGHAEVGSLVKREFAGYLKGASACGVLAPNNSLQADRP